MAATMHAKINRRKLDKLNIIKICEEILNPSVPMALRLSGILMGGVVIVYERKVKLLYDDVTRLLVEINDAWKVKAVPDPTLLPKGKSQAKYEAVTLPDNQGVELGEIEQSLNNMDTVMGFQETGYFAMRLDNVEEPFINNNPREEDQSEQYHQADVANITLSERFDSYQTNTDAYNRFERFDIEGDGETQLNFTSHERTQIPSTLIPSPPYQADPQKPADEILDQHPEDQANPQSDEGKAVSQPQQDHRKQGTPRRKARKPAAFVMDYEQTIIPGHIYQSWLQSASDIVSRRGRKRKRFNALPTMKIRDLMDLPPTVLVCGLFVTGNRGIHYPAPLLELWMRSTRPPHDSPSGRISPPQPSSSSPADRAHHNDRVGLPSEDFHSGIGSQSLGVSIEKLRKTVNVNELPNEFFIEELRSNLVNNGVRVAEVNVMVTPRNSGDEVKSMPSSGSGHGFPSHSLEINSGRSNKKRPYSSSRHSGSGLEPVAEETSWQHPDPNFKLARLSENGLTPENDLLVETGPTQIQQPILNPPIDHITDSIRMHLKTHFDTPGSSQAESLNQLALGMNKSRAANLFYQTCVLASRDFIRVEQQVAYGDIIISRGAKM
ncbi:sister chromatid cohesion 1 protein 1-like isoform X1 [Actinidia eriantha]|uniref:sister chromatid cohesion 1 protein 1-like isoform X1 n=1 Tax=Actinidia eriantha TaxID=165200 RepID=UPI00258E4738|nr:sister chromatid cohesion 1 protein 1-like isoform X1 [Actinidia eriantha]